MTLHNHNHKSQAAPHTAKQKDTVNDLARHTKKNR